jgi:hypothetical protein
MANPHSTDLYVVGKGIVTIAEWSGGAIGTYYDVGNCPSFQVEPVVENLPHYSHRSGYRTKDKNPVINTEYTLTFDLDEFSASNMMKILIGNLSSGFGKAMVIHALQATTKEFAIKFTSDNPTGPDQVWDFWKVSLRPAGPIQLIGDEWLVMNFTGEGLADTALHPVSPYFDVDFESGYTETSVSESSDSSSSTSVT